jgi:hypothetical protein
MRMGVFKEKRCKKCIAFFAILFFKESIKKYIMTITFSSCFYILKSKFDPSIYVEWANNLISIVNNFNLVIYTDANSIGYINTRENPRIKVILKPIDKFYNYKYSKQWIKNHDKNTLLNNLVDWKVNMLWSEKVWFVNETIKNKYFNTDLYGWCDIGYFRNRPNDLNTNGLKNWPNPHTLEKFDPTQIYYACVNNNDNLLNDIYSMVNTKNNVGLPSQEIPPFINFIAGGFFILHRNNIDWWAKTYDNKLNLYYLVKDDQIILVDCIMTDFDKFTLYRENDNRYDNWFMFQRILV